MRIAILHNPNAGGGTELVEILEGAGHEVALQNIEESGYGSSGSAPDLVLVAGGDGTVGRAAAAWAWTGVPLAVFPSGTANNIAGTLGIPGDFAELPAILAAGRSRKLDLGIAHGPWGTRHFIEGAGLGLLARMLAVRGRDKKLGIFDPVDRMGSIAGGLRIMERLLDQFAGCEVGLTVDGQDCSGTYLMIEALNIRSIGPALTLAPDADPGDGLLDLILVREDQRDEFAHFLAKSHGSAAVPLRWFTRQLVREVRISFTGAEIHLDDFVWPEPEANAPGTAAEASIAIALHPGAVDVLMP